MDLLPIRPVKFDQARNTAQNGSKFTGMIPNSTRPEILLKLGVNP